ncbi:MAG: hypothetical protein H6618_09880 [Deltaproteobacteria bacterium]|nr:hypothetical protein [Deltaproteobacteria bacterium]
MSLLLAQSVMLAKGSLFIAGMPEKSRWDTLSSFFEPPPGTEVHLDSRDLNHSVMKKNFHKLRGWIMVTPPPDRCLIIRKKDHKEDKRICKKTYVSYQLMDIEGDGKIRWDISTGPDDFGTSLWWKTPYLIGKYVNYEMRWPGPSMAFYVKACIEMPPVRGERVIELHLIPEKKIKILFPENEILAPQPERDAPNLYIQENNFSNGFMKMEKKNKKNKDHLMVLDDDDPNTIRSDWQLHPRNSYQLDSSKVMTGQSRKNDGFCRYRYSGYEFDPQTPVLECHKISEFQWLYLPLSCIKK